MINYKIVLMVITMLFTAAFSCEDVARQVELNEATYSEQELFKGSELINITIEEEIISWEINMSAKGRYTSVEVFVAPEADGASFALTKARRVAVVPHDEGKFDIGSLNLDPTQSYYLRARYVNKAGKKGDASVGALFVPNARTNRRPVGHYQLETTTINTTDTLLTIDTATKYDPFSMHDPSFDRFTLPKDGVYKISVSLQVRVISAPGSGSTLLLLGYRDPSLLRGLRGISIVPASGELHSLDVTFVKIFEQGDVIDFAMNRSGSAASIGIGLATGLLRNFVSIEYVGSELN